MINWKVAIGSGIAGAVLSLLTGIISGVSFGTLLLRALMWGALFCGVGIGAWFLLSKYLPELVSAGGAGTQEATNESGPTVDIVLPDENPHIDGEGDTPAGRGDEPGGPQRRAAREKSGGTQADALIEEVEEAQAERRAQGGAPQDQETVWDDGAPDGDLPDLDEESPESDSGNDSGFRPQGLADISNVTRHGDTIDVLGHEANSEEIAQAIRTAMHRDQKG